MHQYSTVKSNVSGDQKCQKESGMNRPQKKKIENLLCYVDNIYSRAQYITIIASAQKIITYTTHAT